jgi:O-acetylserine/cysteine efflux transporter
MGASTFFLDESLPLWKILAASLVITGLVLNLFWPKLLECFRSL